MITTVIFDMDGVIVDSEPVHYDAYQQHFKELNISVTDELYRSFTGNSTRNIYQKLINQFHLSQDVNDLVLRKRALFNYAFDHKEDLYLLPGVESLIKELHLNNFKLILASSSSHVTINRIFKRFNLDQYFLHKVSGEEFPKSKPDPAIFIKAAQLSGDTKNNCIVIEDSTNGIKAAHDAGIFCLGYNGNNQSTQDFSLANKVIYDYSEIDISIIRNFSL